MQQKNKYTLTIPIDLSFNLFLNNDSKIFNIFIFNISNQGCLTSY